MADTPHALVLFGATSFVGRLTAAHLARHYPDRKQLDWAIAGRSQARLEALRDELGLPDLAIITADVNDPASLKKLVSSARVVASTVGPYALFGEPLVAACARAGTDYCDLTGEPHWVRQMIQKYEGAALGSGARIVHCCGFDSLPSDLGVFFLQQEAERRFGAPCNRVRMRVRAMRGGFSGGTVASIVQLAREVRANPGLRKELADPYSTCPPGYRPQLRQPNANTAQFDPVLRAWTAPFIMAAANTRVVQRSNALSGQAYGADFRYDEAVLTGRGAKGRLAAYGITAAIAAFIFGVALKPSRALLERFVLPAPGEGPSPKSQAQGFFDIRFYGQTAQGETLIAKVTGDRDPGYGSTSKMLAETAICLGETAQDDAHAGGFPTPATLLGQRLIERLTAHAGLTFELLD